MARTVTFVTPENVELSYELAGLGSRFLAALTDVLIQLLFLIVLVLFLAIVQGGGDSLDVEVLGPWGMAAAFLVLLFIIWGYYAFFETRWNGQTPGKRQAGIRVIRDGGYPVDFRAAAIRNLVRYADFFPGFYGLGTIAIFLSARHQRLGDYAAGTLVVKERGREDVAPTAPLSPAEKPRVFLTEAMLLNVARLTLDDYRAIRHFLDRRGELQLTVATALASRLAHPINLKLGGVVPIGGAAAAAFLEEVAVEYEKRHRM